MPNRYANLTPSAKISQEYTKITEGFDKVQSEMDQRIAKDNDLQSQLTNERQQRIAADNAHQNSTAAHPAEHITYSGKVSGATNVKQAADRLSDRIDNIVAQGGSDNTEVVDARMGADGVARPTLGTFVREIHAQQIDSARQTVTLKHGHNIVTTDQASPADFLVRGRTLVNLLGNDGGFESLEPFTTRGNPPILASNIKKFGTHSVKCVGESSESVAYKDYDLTLDKAKYYLFSGWMYLESYESGTPNISIRDKGTFTTRYIATAVITAETIGVWQFVYAKIPANNIITTDGFRFLFGLTGSSSNSIVYIDGVSLYEITAEEYAKIDVDPEWTGEKLAERFPYVDGLKSVVNPVITKYGKNLLSPYPRTISSHTKIIGPYELEMSTTSGQNYNAFQVPVIGNTKYTLSCDVVKLSGSGNAYGYLTYWNAQGNAIGTSSYVTPTQKKITVTTPANAVRADFTQQCDGSVSAVFKNWQLELGEVATPFEPRNDDHVYAECTLRSLPNGVRDVLDVSRKEKLANVGQVLLNGSENWSNFVKTETYCQVAVINWQSAHNAIRFFHVNNTDAALAWSDDLGRITIASDPTFGIPSVGITSGGALTLSLPPTFDSLGEVKTYLAEHPITLVYQLANPITETVSVEGAIALHDGQNIIEVGEGAIREKVNFDISTKRADLSQRSARVLAVHKNANPVAFTAYTSNNSVQPQLIEDVDPDAEYTVWYQALDKYALTTSVNDVTATYNTNQKMVVDSLAKDMADAKTEISIHDRILAEYAARLLALEEG